MANNEPIGLPADEGQLLRMAQERGGLNLPRDARAEGLEGGANILEMFPDAYVVHWRNTALAVDPTAGLVQTFIFVCEAALPWAAYAVGSYFELALPNVAPCLNGYLRVGTNISAISQNAANPATGALSEFEPWFAQISGTKGAMVRINRPHMPPFGRRVDYGQPLVASLQVVTTGVGVAFTVEYDVQTYVLNLNRFIASEV